MKNTKKIAMLGIGIATYVVLSCIFKIPILAGTHLQTDLGYVAFGVFLVALGPIATIIGVIGCLLESLLFSGWVPIGWMLGQLAIGLICGFAYKKNKITWLNIVITIVAVFIGVGGIKTGIECFLYDIPVLVKLPKNIFAAIADAIPMVGGYLLAIKTALKKYINK